MKNRTPFTSVAALLCVVAPLAVAGCGSTTQKQAETTTEQSTLGVEATTHQPREWAYRNYRFYTEEALAVQDATKAASIDTYRKSFQKSGYRTHQNKVCPLSWQEAQALLSEKGYFTDLVDQEPEFYPADSKIPAEKDLAFEQYQTKVWTRLGVIAEAYMSGKATLEEVYTKPFLLAILHYGNKEIERSNYVSRFHESCFMTPTATMNIYYAFMERMDAIEAGEKATNLEKEVCMLLKVVALQAWTQPIRHDDTDNDVTTIDRFRKHVWWVGGNGLAYRSLLPIACMIKSIPMIDLLAEVAQRGISCTSQNTFDDSFWTEGFTADGAGWGHGMQCLVWGYPVDGTNAALTLLTSLQGTVWAQKLSEENKAALFNYVRGGNWYYYKGYELPCLDRHSAHYLAQGKEIKTMILIDTLLKNWKDSFTPSELAELQQFAQEAATQNIRMNRYADGFYNGTRYFFNNDDLIKKNDDYHIIVNMSSVRCDGIESAPEMADGYNFTTCDGLTLFQRSGREYMDMLGAFDPLQAPGITARLGFEKLTPVTNWRGYCSKHNYAGGATAGGENGVAGYIFEKMNGSAKENVNDQAGLAAENAVLYGVQAHKSYFMLGDYTVALGAGVTNLHPEMEGDIHTTLEQTSLTAPLYLYANGKTTALEEGIHTFNTTPEGGEWVVQEGKFAYTTLPAYTPKGYVQNENRTCDWVKRNIENKKVKGYPTQARVLQLWADHGQTPKNDTYGYVVYAGKGLPAAELPFTVLRNDTQIQAIASTQGDVVEAVFYDATQTLAVGENKQIAVSAPCVVLLEQVNGAWRVAISDAQMDKNLNEVTLTVNGKPHIVTMPQGDQCGKPAVQTLVL